jgi:hypothetical protein
METYMLHHIVRMITSPPMPSLREEEAPYSFGGPLRQVNDQFSALVESLGRKVTTELRGYTYCTHHPSACSA